MNDKSTALMQAPNDTLRQSVCGAGRLTGRLRDESGVSILIALFFFLVCAVVGGVVLTAATVTSGNLANLESSQQSYYATSSASQLMRDAIVGSSCTLDGSDWNCKLSKGASAASNSDLSAWLSEAVASVADNGQPVTKESKVTVFHGADDQNIPAVSMKLTMAEDYSITVTCQPADYQEGSAEATYRTVCKIKPSVLWKDPDAETLQPEKVSWKQGLIRTYGSAAAAGGE